MLKIGDFWCFRSEKFSNIVAGERGFRDLREVSHPFLSGIVGHVSIGISATFKMASKSNVECQSHCLKQSQK